MDRDEGVKKIEGALKLVKSSLNDWYLIERAEHDGRVWMESTGPDGASLMASARISDADIEGPPEHMQGIAKAILARENFHAKRCAVAIYGDRVEFWSPRNSQVYASVPLAVADELAAQIMKELP